MVIGTAGYAHKDFSQVPSDVRYVILIHTYMMFTHTLALKIKELRGISAHFIGGRRVIILPRGT